MPNAVRLSDLRDMGAAERAAVLERLAADSLGEPNGRVDYALARVRQFETTYECKSAQLLERLHTGEMRETNDIVHWLHCLKILSLSGR